MPSKHAAILEAATWLFATKGFHEASTTDVAKRTGVAEGTVFYHFESKEKLFLAVLADVRARLGEAFAGVLPELESRSGLDAYEHLIEHYLQLAAEHEPQFMLLHRHFAYDLARVNEQCRGSLEAIYDQIISTFQSTIDRGQKEGAMAALPTHKTALLVFMMIDGLVRLNHSNLYEAGSLFPDFMYACRRLVRAEEVKS